MPSQPVNNKSPQNHIGINLTNQERPPYQIYLYGLEDIINSVLANFPRRKIEELILTLNDCLGKPFEMTRKDRA
jgi:hypothetical protein